jgi:hypothetical protein
VTIALTVRGVIIEGICTNAPRRSPPKIRYLVAGGTLTYTALSPSTDVQVIV